MNHIDMMKNELNYMHRVRHWSNEEFWTDKSLPKVIQDAHDINWTEIEEALRCNKS